MTPTQTQNGPEQKRTLVSVFDLKEFDIVQLVRFVEMPAKPTSVHEALQALGGDTEALLNVIYDGLCERAIEASRKDLSTFKVLGEDDKLPVSPKDIVALEDYNGTPVSEAKGKSIAAAVLGIAKAMGYSKDLPKETKASLKQQALDFMKGNPAMLASIQG